MGRYASHEDFGANAPIKYRDESTSESYLKGMSVIAPPGMMPRISRGSRFEAKTDFKASALWHRNFDVAMFGGSDIGTTDFESRQLYLEAKRDGIKQSGERE
jgi:hypothetical protein